MSQIHRSIANIVLDILHTRDIRITPASLRRDVREALPVVSERDIRSVLRDLVNSGALVYTNHFNTTHLELGQYGPRILSNRIVACPPNSRYHPTKTEVVVRLNDGTAFGAGDHPTSKLMLRGIKAMLAGVFKNRPFNGLRICDIGTGTGILALAAAALGVGYILAVDVDPLACREARENVRLNGFPGRIVISDALPEKDSQESFDMILANLRPPTLKALFAAMIGLSKSEAVWILSGFRAAEEGSVLSRLNGCKERVVWRETSHGWCATGLSFDIPAMAVREGHKEMAGHHPGSNVDRPVFGLSVGPSVNPYQ
jgi:ribosomal protein L11 methyltransferase